MMLLASKGIYFLKSIPEDEDSPIFFFYHIEHSVCDQLLPYLEKNPKKCFTTN